MAMVVKNNMSAVSTLNTLNKNSSSLQKSLAKVSSGLKITSAQDDASGYAISERMRVRIRALDQATQNTQNGSSLMKTAEGALSSTIELLKTLKEKAINAATDTNTDEDRKTIQKEVDQFIDQIDDNALVTFNGKYLLEGSKSQPGIETYTTMTNQSLALDTIGTDKLTSLRNRKGESLEIVSSDKVTASYVKDGLTYTTSYNVGKTTLSDIFTNLNKLAGGEVFGNAQIVSGDDSTDPIYSEPTLAFNNINAATLQELSDAFNAQPKSRFDLELSAMNDAVATAFAQFVTTETSVTNNLYTNLRDAIVKDLATVASNSGATATLYYADTDTGALTTDSGAAATRAVVGDEEGNTEVATAPSVALTVGYVAIKNANAEGGYDLYSLYNTNDPDTEINPENISTIPEFFSTAAQAIMDFIDDKLKEVLQQGGSGEITSETMESILSENVIINAGGLIPSQVGYNRETVDSISDEDATNIYTFSANTTRTVRETTEDDEGNSVTTSDLRVAFSNTFDTDAFAPTLSGEGVANGIGIDSPVVTDYAKYKAEEIFVSSFNGLVMSNDEVGVVPANRADKTVDGSKGITVTAAQGGLAGQISGITINITSNDGQNRKSVNEFLNAFETTIFAANESSDHSLNIHVGAEANLSIAVGIADMRSEALGLKGSDGTIIKLSTLDQANAAISAFENALQKALDQQTTIGAIEARLEYTESNLVTSSENVQAAESTIRDADMAKEMTNYTKNNVLLQAAQSMLAQANQNSSAVLSLLQ